MAPAASPSLPARVPGCEQPGRHLAAFAERAAPFGEREPSTPCRRRPCRPASPAAEITVQKCGGLNCSFPPHRSAPAAAAPPAAGGEGGGPPPPPPNLTSNRRLQQTQAQVDEVVDIMRVNVDKVLERDQKLSELDDRADALQAGASQFETSAAKLKRKYWWKNLKMMIILGVICTVILIIIIVYFST
ncbi:vesicle-associated membrane protein 2 [Heteronotia binoei]|uniref:vesicle-associated membrane protein 2 n=1 Tax=Heteronotia binoei TaxID=13085 RepID=UPI00292DC5DA|nr:vesicle-associated membrane protein 2 [Heteronotia binoei]